MTGKADLHIHTTCSDGRLTPVEAVSLAAGTGLKAVSITDHDTYEGFRLAESTAKELGIELIPGMEITAVFEQKECHILAYYFDPELDFMQYFVLKQRNERRKRIKIIIGILKENGIDLTYEEVRAVSNGANIGRPHVAKVLIEKGYAASIRDAFMRYLSTEKLGQVDAAYPEAEEAIRLIKKAGGAAVIAHPGRFYTLSQVDKLVAYGADGIECVHPSHKWEYQLKYTEYCDSNALLKTGGSDYHGGLTGARSQVGVVTTAYKNVVKMKRMTDQRKKLSTLK